MHTQKILDTEWYIVRDEQGKRFFYNREKNEMLEKPPPFLIDLVKSKVDQSVRGSVPKKGKSRSASKKRTEIAESIMSTTTSKKNYQLSDLVNVQRKVTLILNDTGKSQIGGIEDRCLYFLYRHKFMKVLQLTESLFQHLFDKYDSDPLSLDERELFSFYKLLYVRALAYVGNKEPKLAIPLIYRMFEIAPDRYESYSVRGELYRILSKFRESIKDIELAKRLNPNDAFIYIQLANSWLGDQNVQKALAVIDNGLEMIPNNYDIMIAKVRLLALMQQFEDSYYLIQTCIIQQPAIADGFVELSHIALVTGHPDEALKSVHEAINRDPSSSQAYTALGHILQEKSSWDEALMAYDVAINNNPRNTEAYEGKIACFSQLRKYNEVMELADHVLLIDAHSLVALFFKANTLENRYEYASARDLYLELVKYEPNNPIYYHRLTECYRQLGDSKKEDEMFSKAIVLTEKLEKNRNIQ